MRFNAQELWPSVQHFAKLSFNVCMYTHSNTHTYIHMSFGLLLQRDCMCICASNVCLCVCVCACVCMWATKLKVCFSQRWGQNCTLPPSPLPVGQKRQVVCVVRIWLCECVCVCVCACMYIWCVCVCVSVWLDKVLGYFLLFNCFSCCCHSRVTAELREKLSALLLPIPPPVFRSVNPARCCSVVVLLLFVVFVVVAEPIVIDFRRDFASCCVSCT